MENSIQILLQIFIMFTAAKVFATVGERFRIPAVISEIAAGIALGPYLLGPFLLGFAPVEGSWLPPEWLVALAQLGAIVLLFNVGLEQKLTDLLRVGWTALLVAIVGVVIPFFLGYGLLTLMERSQTEAVFMGAAMVATSVGITARVLEELGVLKTVVATVILGAAVIDDILAMIMLAVVSGMSEGIDYIQMGTLAGLAIGFTLFILVVGGRVIRGVTRGVQRFVPGNPYFPLAMIICLGLAVAAAKIKIAAIIGAFLAGLVYTEEELAGGLKEKIRALYEFLVPFFFVAMGMQMDIRVLGQANVLLLAALVTMLAILGKLVGCSLGAYRLGWRPALQVGMGMVPRGEVGIIVASIGLGLNLISQETYAVVIIMVLVTTLMAPPFLKVLFARENAIPVEGKGETSPPSKPSSPDLL